MTEKVSIVQLDTGVPGLNEVLGGGLPEFSFNLLAGGPGAGKTTLVHQIAFAIATPERPALYITVLGEPPLKLLRYQQQFAFFDAEKVTASIRFVSIPHEVLEAGLGAVLKQIIAGGGGDEPQPGHRRFLPIGHARGPGSGEKRRVVLAGLRTTVGAATDQLAGHHVPGGGISGLREGR